MTNITFNSTADLGDVFGIFGGAGFIVWAVVGVFSIICMWMIFTKAGKPGWGSIVPFYNTYLLFDITFKNGWMFLLLLIPIVNVVISIMLCFKLSKAFGHGTGFGFGILFLSIIFYGILAFGKSEYVEA